MIHSTAIIDKEAKVADSVEVGPYAVIGKGVSIEDNVVISARAHLTGNTCIGRGTFIGVGAVLGERPQMLGLKENKGNLHIGKNNTIREYVTIHSSTSPDASTQIGESNFLMGFSHLAHDCRLGNNTIIANGTLIAGHAIIDDNAFISGNVVVHQFVRIGRLTMVGGLSRVNQDIPPFMMVVGDSRVRGLNLVGLRRAGISSKEMKALKKAFGIMYRRDLSLKSVLDHLEKIDEGIVREIGAFIHTSRRGICRPKRSTLMEKIFLDYPYCFRSKIPTYHLFLRCRKRVDSSE